MEPTSDTQSRNDHVEVDDPVRLRYWSEALGVRPRELKRAVGYREADILRWLDQQPAVQAAS
jgi:hypothetical protein